MKKLKKSRSRSTTVIQVSGEPEQIKALRERLHKYCEDQKFSSVSAGIIFLLDETLTAMKY